MRPDWNSPRRRKLVRDELEMNRPYVRIVALAELVIFGVAILCTSIISLTIAGVSLYWLIRG